MNIAARWWASTSSAATWAGVRGGGPVVEGENSSAEPLTAVVEEVLWTMMNSDDRCLPTVMNAVFWILMGGIYN